MLGGLGRTWELRARGILSDQAVAGLQGAAVVRPMRALVQFSLTLLFRLEKVYNLAKETMPKKPDGQSGV